MTVQTKPGPLVEIVIPADLTYEEAMRPPQDGEKKFDPRQPRDPHTGQWIDVLPGVGSGGLSLDQVLDGIRERAGIPISRRFEVIVDGETTQGERLTFPEVVDALVRARRQGHTRVEARVGTNGTTRLPSDRENQAILDGAMAQIAHQGQGSGGSASSTTQGELPGMPQGDSTAQWERRANQLADDLRNEPPPLLMTPGAHDPQTVKAVGRYEEIGARAREVVEADPRVVAAEKALADRRRERRSADDPGGEPWRQEQFAANDLAVARANAVHDILRRTRPIAADTGVELNVIRGADTPGGPILATGGARSQENALADTLRTESQGLPAAWVNAINNHYPNLRVADSHSDSMAFVSTTNTFEVADDAHVGDLVDGRPLRIHEMVHAAESASRQLDASNDAYLEKHTNPLESPPDVMSTLFGTGEDLHRPRRGEGNDFFDEYSGREYPVPPGGTELASTGIEYLVGGRRFYSQADKKFDPWHGRYRNHLNYSLGLLLKGGPVDMREDFTLAKLPVPEWAAGS